MDGAGAPVGEERPLEVVVVPGALPILEHQVADGLAHVRRQRPKRDGQSDLPKGRQHAVGSEDHQFARRNVRLGDFFHIVGRGSHEAPMHSRTARTGVVVAVGIHEQDLCASWRDRLRQEESDLLRRLANDDRLGIGVGRRRPQ